MSNSNHPVSGSDKHASTFEAFKAALLARKVPKTAEVMSSLRHSDDSEVPKTAEVMLSLRHSPVHNDAESVLPAPEALPKTAEVFDTNNSIVSLELNERLRQSSALCASAAEGQVEAFPDGFAVEAEESALSLPSSPEAQCTENFDGATAEVTTLLRHSSALGMPAPPDLIYAEVQLFKNDKPVNKGKRDKVEGENEKDNANAKRTVTEWNLKIRAGRIYDPAVSEPELELFFATLSNGGPRRLRERITGWIGAGQLSTGFLNRFNFVTHDLEDRSCKMGLISAKKKDYGPKPGQAKQVYDDQFVMMEFNDDGTPGELTIWLAEDQEPLVLSHWNSPKSRTTAGTIRDKKASRYTAYYDPDHTYWKLRREAREIELWDAEQRALKTHHPVNAIANIMASKVVPVIAPLIEDNKRLVRENEMLRKDVNTLLQARNDQDTINVHLAQCIAELQANLTRP